MGAVEYEPLQVESTEFASFDMCWTHWNIINYRMNKHNVVIKEVKDSNDCSIWYYVSKKEGYVATRFYNIHYNMFYR